MSELKVAIVGCGAVTRKMYVPELNKIPGIRIACVCDLDSGSAREVAESIGAQVATVEEVSGNADAVIIATPPSTHYEIAKLFIGKVKSVICEKPFVCKREQAQELVALAGAQNTSLYVAHFRRFFPNVQMARRIVQSGIIGSITGIEMYEGGRFAWQAASGYITKDPYGGVLYDTGSHTIDTALYIACLDVGSLSLSISVNGIRRDSAEPSHQLEAEFVFSTTEANGTGFLSLSRYQVLSNLIRIVGSNATLEVSTGLDDRVKLIGSKSSVITSTEYTYTDLMDCFRLQYQHIFNGGEADTFNASRFVNLTMVLENVFQAQEK